MNNRDYFYKLIDEDDMNPQHLTALKAHIKKNANLFEDAVNTYRKGLFALREGSGPE